MTKEDIILKLQEMESRYHSGFSSIDRQWLDTVYFDLFGRVISNTGCNSCYRDAYIEIYHKIKTLKEMPKKSDYALKPGALIIFFGEPVAYSNHNITNEVAERYLAQDINLINQFQSFPLDYEKRVAAYKEGVVYEPVEEVDTADLDNMKAYISQLETENDELKARNKALLEYIETLEAAQKAPTAEAEEAPADTAINAPEPATADAPEAEAEEAPQAETQPETDADSEDGQPKAKKAKKTDK